MEDKTVRLWNYDGWTGLFTQFLVTIPGIYTLLQSLYMRLFDKATQCHILLFLVINETHFTVRTMF